MTSAAVSLPSGLSVRVESHVGHVVLDRPDKYNAVSYEIWGALPQVVHQLDADEDVRVIVVSGRGDNFSAGADIQEFRQRRQRPSDVANYSVRVETAERALASVSKPTVAVIQGYCLGGGCELALACDLRLSSETAVLGITAANLGIVYSFHSTRRLVQAVGSSFAKYMLFSGNKVTAVEALRVGLVDRLCPATELSAATDELTRTIASRAQVSVKGSKRLIAKVDEGLSSPDAEARELVTRAAESADYQEGVAAFLEKRRPRF